MKSIHNLSPPPPRHNAFRGGGVYYVFIHPNELNTQFKLNTLHFRCKIQKRERTALNRHTDIGIK